MSKANPLGLIASYGDSDEDSDDGSPLKRDDRAYCPGYDVKPPLVPPGIHPSPIPHCPWSACYDENSGFTYYWNQQSNAVTWEAPSEYLLALKLAQQQLTTAGSTEVSAEEWQLYQQALAEKQTQKVKPATKSILKKPEKNIKHNIKKRSASDEEDEKIELITSYHNSDSESNDETEKPPETPKPNKIPKLVQKKPKLQTLEYGPPLPPNQNYTVPIGPELPPGPQPKPPVPEEKVESAANEEVKLSQKSVGEDRQEERVLLRELKDKAKLLEKLGGELPAELQQMIGDDPSSVTASPRSDREAPDIDVMLEEIEKKELPRVVKSKRDDGKTKCSTSSGSGSPGGDGTPPRGDGEAAPTLDAPSLFPSAANIENVKVEKDNPLPTESEKKENVYLTGIEPLDNVNRKRLRISNSVLPDRKRDRIEVPAYSTRYARPGEGFPSERTGLGFVGDEESADPPKNVISYGNGLTFTRGETLHDEKDEDLDDLTDLVEAKLKFLSQIQPCSLTPVQEMTIQMQTLVSSFRAGALAASYWRRWACSARAALAAHEAAAAPPGWKCVFLRSEARYCYTRDADGFVQFEYPAVDTTDMDICTTPPHSEAKEEVPSWRATPPPPGTDDTHTAAILKKEIGDELQSFYNDIAEIEKSSGTEPNSPEPPPPPPPPEISERMKELREKKEKSREREVRERTKEREIKEKTKERDIKERIKEREIKEKSREKEIKATKKKSKVKLSSSIGMKHKSVSNLVAKWQQVADEIHSD